MASWARYAEGTDEHGEPIEVVDYAATELTTLARAEREHPGAFVRNATFFGDLADDARFFTAFSTVLGDLHAVGARDALGTVLRT